MKSGNQEQMCVKLDRSVLSALELECGVSGIPKNRVINRALVAYTQLIDVTRDYKAGIATQDEFVKWFLCLYSKWLVDPSGSMSLVLSKEGREQWK